MAGGLRGGHISCCLSFSPAPNPGRIIRLGGKSQGRIDNRLLFTYSGGGIKEVMGGVYRGSFRGVVSFPPPFFPCSFRLITPVCMHLFMPTFFFGPPFCSPRVLTLESDFHLVLSFRSPITVDIPLFPLDFTVCCLVCVACEIDHHAAGMDWYRMQPDGYNTPTARSFPLSCLHVQLGNLFDTSSHAHAVPLHAAA